MLYFFNFLNLGFEFLHLFGLALSFKNSGLDRKMWSSSHLCAWGCVLRNVWKDLTAEVRLGGKN